MKPISYKEKEEIILSKFLIAYKKRFGVDLKKKNHRDKPDFEVINTITGECIGIEVTGTYQSNEEAIIQNRRGGEAKIGGRDVKDWDIFTGNSEDFIADLNNRIADKVNKLVSYTFSGRILLVIWCGSLNFNEKFDIDFIRGKINIPQNDYSEIWLIIREKEDNSPALYPLQI